MRPRGENGGLRHWGGLRAGPGGDNGGSQEDDRRGMSPGDGIIVRELEVRQSSDVSESGSAVLRYNKMGFLIYF